MNFVFRCLRKRLCCSPMICSKGGAPTRGLNPPRSKRQLEPALLESVVGLPKFCRVGGVNQHGDPQFAGFRPDRVETGIVDGDPIPIGVERAQPQALEDLQTGGPGGDIRFELGRRPLTPSGLAHTSKVDVGEKDEASRVVAGHVLEPCDEARSASARQVDHDRHVEFIHLPD